MRSMTIELPSMVVYCEELNCLAEIFFNYEIGGWRIDFGDQYGGEVPILVKPINDYDWAFVGQFETPNLALRT